VDVGESDVVGGACAGLGKSSTAQTPASASSVNAATTRAALQVSPRTALPEPPARIRRPKPMSGASGVANVAGITYTTAARNDFFRAPGPAVRNPSYRAVTSSFVSARSW